MRDASPLRYPGGKWRLFPFFKQLIENNFDKSPLYMEPFAGGSSLALSLLIADIVCSICLNDLDPAIYAFWASILNETDRFCEYVRSTPVTPKEWEHQKSIFVNPNKCSQFQLGFAAFFLNRTNHSGIFNAGMIGGRAQEGTWKIDARFNREELVRRIRRIAALKTRISVTNEDALQFLKRHTHRKNALIYLDPPYFRAGQRLYLNAYQPEDHNRIAASVTRLKAPWVVSYDNAPQIRVLYARHQSFPFKLLYSARTVTQGAERMYFSEDLKLPRGYSSIIRGIAKSRAGV